MLAALGCIPRTAKLRCFLPSEAALAVTIGEHASQGSYGVAFCGAVLAKWNSPGVAAVLASRGVSCSTGCAQRAAAVAAEFAGRNSVDEQAHGLRSCPFPSCRRVEKTVSEFRQCAGCRSAWYCSAEHQALEWTTHKLKCAELYAARREAISRRSSRRLGTSSWADADAEAIGSLAAAALGLTLDKG